MTKVEDVFTPNSYPTITYVQRSEQHLEQSLRDALDTPGTLISVAGPSKSGKTVLIRRVVGEEYLIPISGEGIERSADLWKRVLNWMQSPVSRVKTDGLGGSVSAEASAAGGVNLLGIGKAEAGAKGGVQATKTSQTASTFSDDTLAQVVRDIAGSKYTVLLDDFHYMERTAQIEVAKSLKHAQSLGIRIVTASVPHRINDAARVNSDMRGRVVTLDLKYWIANQLRRIADLGFEAMNVSVASEALDRFVEESAGSPQLMQLICLNACRHLEVRSAPKERQKLQITAPVADEILRKTAMATNYQNLVNMLVAGPRTRGVERKTFQFEDAPNGDVYRCVLHAIAASPPRQSFTYDEIVGRTRRVCTHDSPGGASVTTTLEQMAKLAVENFPDERILEWDEQKLEITDPYLVFYLRWSGRLKEE